MADFSVSDVASRVKGPEGISLADMMNMAIGAQKYNQAERINPLLERQQSAITTEAEETLQPKIARTKAETQRSVYEADKAGVDLRQHYANIGRGLFGGFLTDPDFLNGNSDKMISKIEGAKNYAETVLGVPKEILNNSDRIIDMIKKSPQEGYQYIKNGVLQSGENQAQTNLVTPQTLTNAQNQIVQLTPATGDVSVAGKTVNAPIVNPNPTSAEASLANRTVEANVQNFGDYQKDLTARVTASTNNLLRTTEARDLLSKFKPGAGSSVYADIAQKLQAIGAPQNLVDKVAGGDLGATQSFNKFLAQSVISGVRQAAGGDQTRVAEVENFLKNNPTVNTDPRALNKLFDFTDKLAKKDFAEQEFLIGKIKTNKLNPQTHFGEVQQFLREQNIVPKIGETKSGGHGKVVATAKKGNVTYVKYEDGFVAPQ